MKRQPIITAVLVAPVFFLMLCCKAVRVPDLPRDEAARLISQAPEFNKYARLVSVGDLNHPGDSMEHSTDGPFTFRYLKSPADAPPIQASAQFAYWNDTWHLSNFSYGCPGVHLDDCRNISVHNDPPKQPWTP